MKTKKLLATLALISAVLITGCKKDDYKEKVGVCPTVTTIPIDKAINVPLNQIIYAIFNEVMNPATITQASFTLQQGATAIIGPIGYSGKTATLTPSSPLTPFTLYTGRVTTLAKDLMGNSLQTDYVWTFTTIPQVTLSSNPAAGGTTNGAGTFAQGSEVTVTAAPNTGYVFTSWTENGTVVSTTSSYKFTMPAGNRTLVANFTFQFSVVLSSNPIAGGTTTGAGSYNAGSSVTVTALPNSGYTFTNWTEGLTIVSTDANYIFTINGNRTLVANFTAIQYTVTLSSNPAAGGTTTGGGTFNSGSSVTVRAIPNAGYTFTNWKEGVTVVSTDANYTFTITGNRTLVANFTAIPYSVTLSSNPPAGGNPTGGGQFNSGDQVTVKANPNAGYIFKNWTDNGTIVSTDPNYTFTITSNRTLVANYTARYTIILSSNPPAGGNPTGGGQFDSGASVIVAANPNSGYTFTNWTEGANIVSSNANYTFTITGNRNLVANFAALPAPTVLSTNPADGDKCVVPDKTVSVIFSLPMDPSNPKTSFTLKQTLTSTPVAGEVTYSGTTASFNPYVNLLPNTLYTATITTGAKSLTGIPLAADFVWKFNTGCNPIVTLSSSPALGGTTDGAGSFSSGTSVTVTASKNPLYNFVNWTEGGVIVSSSPSYQFTMPGNNRYLVANFSLIPVTHAVTLSSVPLIGGTTTGEGTYNEGASVTVTATKNPLYNFVNWTEGGVIVSTSPGYQFTMPGNNRALVANFSLIPAGQFAITLSAIPIAGGTIVGQGTYSQGASVTVTATKNPLYNFVNWTEGGAIVSTSPGYQFTMPGNNRALTANFTPVPPIGPGVVNLGTAGNFAILSKSGISTTGVTSITGDIGVSPIAATGITGFGLIMDTNNQSSHTPMVSGKVYASDYAAPTPTKMTTAVSDMETAYTTANGLTTPAPIVGLGFGNISGMTLAPGLYKWSTGVLITDAGVTLSGGPNDTWVFQIAQNLTVGSSAIIHLIGGAQAKNIVWVVAGQATLGSYTDFNGIILSKTLISLNTGAQVNGRLLAQTAVTITGGTITQP